MALYKRFKIKAGESDNVKVALEDGGQVYFEVYLPTDPIDAMEIIAGISVAFYTSPATGSVEFHWEEDVPGFEEGRTMYTAIKK